ncbi:sn-glycerol-1-phosphate dehydrogenase [Eubacteriales bacterium OttesenSCG-928-N13]|nr:sn-glycerol-1-phosphate dehydrogenase [Eubacteriales bacterium OttesenSCG-928-N13]
MSIRISYHGDRLQMSNLKCHCGHQHNQPMQDIYVGTGLIDQLASYVDARELGTNCVLVADEITYEVAGRKAYDALIKGGYQVTLCVLQREGELIPDESAVGEVLMTMSMSTEFFVSVGSGSITDTTRTVAAQTERPFVCVGTAPSMDGYTSVIAPMILRGTKVHVQAICPEIIVCDLDVLRTAPVDMFISGVGDVLGKYIAKADWVISSIVTDEIYCPSCGEIVTDAVNKLLKNIPEIKARTETGTRILIEALLLAGMTIMVIGNTRAVASVEHNIAHYWEMQQLQAGKRPPQHGTSVGVSTLLIWPYFEQFKALDPSKFDKQRALSQQLSHAQRERFMIESYGEATARSIMKENPGDFLTPEQLAARFDAVSANFHAIVQELNQLPSYDTIRQAMIDLGSPLLPSEIDIDEALTHRSLMCAKDYRTRYTLFKSIDELGLSPDSPEFAKQV